MKLNNLQKISRHFVAFMLLMSMFVGTRLLAAPTWETQTGFETNGTIKNAFVSSGEGQNIGQVIGNVINIALGFLGIIFVVILVMAGFKYFTAQGSEAKTKEAISSIKTAVIGLIIILMSYAITEFVMRNAVTVTSTGGAVVN